MRNKRTRTKYAMKCIRKAKVLALGQEMLLMNEKRLMSHLQHENIVQLLQACDHSHHAVHTMAFTPWSPS